MKLQNRADVIDNQSDRRFSRILRTIRQVDNLLIISFALRTSEALLGPTIVLRLDVSYQTPCALLGALLGESLRG